MSATCPPNTVDERAARVVAGLIVATVMVSATFPAAWWFIAIAAGDFALRAWVSRRYSPLRWLAKRLLAMFDAEPRPVYAPPKRFAAQIGSVLTLAATALHLAGMHEAAVALSALLAIAASLEAFAGFCVACYLHPLIFGTRSA